MLAWFFIFTPSAVCTLGLFLFHLAGFPYEQKKKISGNSLVEVLICWWFSPLNPAPHTHPSSVQYKRMTDICIAQTEGHPRDYCQVRSDGSFTSDMCMLWRTGIRTRFLSQVFSSHVQGGRHVGDARPQLPLREDKSCDFRDGKIRRTDVITAGF